MVRQLDRDQVAHVIRAASAITGATELVLIGTAAVIAQMPNLPAALARTREVDLFVPRAKDIEAASDLIDGTIGEGSSFDVSFGYYAHGVGPTTAHLPDGWQERAHRFPIPVIGSKDISQAIAICPEIHDIAASKLSAWREKDKDWLLCALTARIIFPATLRERAKAIRHPAAVASDDVDTRMQILRSAQQAAQNSKTNSPER